MFPYINIGNVASISTYSVGIAISIIAGVFYFLFNQQGIKSITSRVILMFISNAVGAVVMSVLTVSVLNELEIVPDHYDVIFSSVNGHLVVLAFFLLVCSLTVPQRHETAYCCLESYFLFLIIFRIVACLPAGCCHGYPSSHEIGLVFAEGSAASSNFPGQHVMPTQILEALWAIIALYLLTLMYKKWRQRVGMILFICGLIGTLRIPVIQLRYIADKESYYSFWGATIVLFSFSIALLFRKRQNIEIISSSSND